VYDITNKESFDNLNGWIKIIEETLTKRDSLYILVGNKLDLSDKREVFQNDIDLMCQKNNISESLEISCKSQEKLDDLLYILINNSSRRFKEESINLKSINQRKEGNNNYRCCI
jgi:GTPase SAR1 family protein